MENDSNAFGQRFGRVATVVILVMLLAAPRSFINEASGETRETFSNGAREATIMKFPDNSTSIQLENNSFAVSARMNVTCAMSDPSKLDSFPLRPFVDIGNDSTHEFEFNGTGYGKMGYQTLFSDGNDSQTFTIRKGEDAHANILLPYNASVEDASFDVRGWTPIEFQKENLTMDGFTNIAGHALDPFLVEYDNVLYVLWSTNVTTVNDGNKDFDLMFRKYNDSKASTMQLNLYDSEYDDQDSTACVFNGKLYVAWVRYWHDDVQRSDIMLASYDGTYWSTERMMSPDDYHDNDDAELIVYKNYLYLFWRTNDDTIRDRDDYYVNDDPSNLDFVYRTCGTNGIWGSTIEFDSKLSNDDEDNNFGTGGKYWSFDVKVCYDKLFIVFDTDVLAYASPRTGAYDYEVVVESFDGYSWSNGIRLSRTGDRAYDQIPQLSIFDNPITGKQELFAVWITDMLNGSESSSSEAKKNNYRDDIVYSVYNGAYWSPMQWISPREDWYTDCYPSVSQFNGLLYVVWVHGLNVNITESDQSYGSTYSIRGDIYLRIYDGATWLPIRELTNGTNIDNASSPGLFTYDNTFYAIWDQWWGNAGNIVPMKLAAFKVDSNITLGSARWTSFGGLSSTPKTVTLDPTLVKVKETIATTRIDAFGNEMCEINLTVFVNENATIVISGLKLKYNYTATIWNFSSNLNLYMRNHKPIMINGRGDPVYTIPISVGANSTGKLILRDLLVEYHVNHAPVAQVIPVMSTLEDTDAPSLLNLSDYFFDDFDNGSLEYLIACDTPDIISFVESNGTFGVFIKKTNWNGVVNFTIVALDSMGLRSNATVMRLEVIPVNDPPIYLNKLKSAKVRVGESWNAFLDEHFYDVEGNIEIYTCSHPELVYDAKSHVVRWTPTHRSSSLHNVTFTAFERGTDPNYNVSSTPINLFVVPLDSSVDTCGCLPGLLVILIVVAIALTFYIGRKFRKDDFDLESLGEDYERTKKDRENEMDGSRPAPSVAHGEKS